MSKIKILITECAKYYGVDAKIIKQKGHKKQQTKAKRAAYFLTHTLLKYNVYIMMEHFGKDRTTFLAMIQKTDKLYQSSADFKADVEAIKAKVLPLITE